jgi:large conductance mechanosensitive channel
VSIASEFKEFAMKGNVVTSLVADIIMPPIGLLIGGINFSEFAVKLGTDPKGAPVLLKYGEFLQTVFDFLIIAFVIFIAVKGINKLKKPAPPAADAPPPPPTREEVLLTEIRDALVKK